MRIPFFRKKEENLEESFAKANQNNQLLALLSPDSIQEDENYIRSGENYTRTLVAVDYRPILDSSSIRAINEMSENISIVQHLSIFPTEEVKKKFSESIKQNTHKIYSKYVTEAGKSDAQTQINSARATLDQLSYKSERMFMFHLVIHLVENSKDGLDALTQLVKARVGSFTKTITPSTRLKDAFDSFLPLGKNKVVDLTYRPMNAEAVAYFFPFHENEIFDEKGLIKGRNIQTGNVTCVDDNELLNRHEFVVGITGSGKSTYLFMDLCRKYMIGRRIIVIDPKGEFGSKFKKMGGEWIKFSFSGGNIVNPMEIPKASGEADEGNPLLAKINTLVTMFRLMYPEMTDLQEDVLSKMLIELYASEPFKITDETDIRTLKPTDFPILSDLYDFLENKRTEDPEEYERVRDFHMTLHAYARGMFAKILNGHTNVDVNNPLVSYDIFDLQNRKKIQRVVYFNLMSHITYDILNGNKQPTQLYIDEAHIIADPKVPVAMEYLFFMMKVLRSFNCGVTPATQSVTDFLSAKDESRNYGEVVISQALQRLYLAMNESEITYLENELKNKFSESERSAITVIEGRKDEQAGRGIYMVGSKKIKMKVELTDIEKQLWFEDKPIGEIMQ